MPGVHQRGQNVARQLRREGGADALGRRCAHGQAVGVGQRLTGERCAEKRTINQRLAGRDPVGCAWRQRGEQCLGVFEQFWAQAHSLIRRDGQHDLAVACQERFYGCSHLGGKWLSGCAKFLQDQPLDHRWGGFEAADHAGQHGACAFEKAIVGDGYLGKRQIGDGLAR